MIFIRLSKLRAGFYGLDLSAKAGIALKNLEVLVQFRKRYFPLSDNCFDVIYHKSLLEHLESLKVS